MKNSRFRSMVEALVEKSKVQSDPETGISTSKDEDYVYEQLKAKFGEVERQYKDEERHPWMVDYYIPSEDMFIEYNKHWTHGRKKYDPLNPLHQEDVDWLKSKDGEFYDRALRQWTEKDVEKERSAVENNLNYVVFFNLREFERWLENPELTYEEYADPDSLKYDSEEYFDKKAQGFDTCGNDSVKENFNPNKHRVYLTYITTYENRWENANASGLECYYWVYASRRDYKVGQQWFGRTTNIDRKLSKIGEYDGELEKYSIGSDYLHYNTFDKEKLAFNAEILRHAGTYDTVQEMKANVINDTANLSMFLKQNTLPTPIIENSDENDYLVHVSYVSKCYNNCQDTDDCDCEFTMKFISPTKHMRTADKSKLNKQKCSWSDLEPRYTIGAPYLYVGSTDLDEMTVNATILQYANTYEDFDDMKMNTIEDMARLEAINPAKYRLKDSTIAEKKSGRSWRIRTWETWGGDNLIMEGEFIPAVVGETRIEYRVGLESLPGTFYITADGFFNNHKVNMNELEFMVWIQANMQHDKMQLPEETMNEFIRQAQVLRTHWQNMRDAKPES